MSRNWGNFFLERLMKYMGLIYSYPMSKICLLIVGKSFYGFQRPFLCLVLRLPICCILHNRDASINAGSFQEVIQKKKVLITAEFVADQWQMEN